MDSMKGYFRVMRATANSPRFLRLSAPAQAAYLRIGLLYFGNNNGKANPAIARRVPYVMEERVRKPLQSY
jgi:hypothetical protein